MTGMASSARLSLLMPRAGHWVAFLRQNGVWWRVDSNHRGPILENPFDTQLDPSQATRANDFTIDILFFA